MNTPQEGLTETLGTLLDRTLQGDTVAREFLAARLCMDIAQFLRRQLGQRSRDDVADFTQDAVFRLLTQLASCRTRTTAGIHAWAYATARRVAFDYWRANEVLIHSCGIEAASSLHAPPDELTEHGPLVPDGTLHDSSSDSESLAVRVAILAAASQRALSEITQELLYLRLIEGRSWREIGAALSLPPSAAKRRFQRGQHALRRELLRSLVGEPEPIRARAIVWLCRATRHDRSGTVAKRAPMDVST